MESVIGLSAKEIMDRHCDGSDATEIAAAIRQLVDHIIELEGTVAGLQSEVEDYENAAMERGEYD